MSTDIFEKLAELSLERQKLDAQLAELRARRDETDARMREVAALIVATPTAPVVVTPGPSPDPSEFDDIQRRMRELLGVMKQFPGEHTESYAKRMYGKTTNATKRSVTAYCSRLKAKDYIEAVDRGRFKLTAKGVAAAIEP